MKKNIVIILLVVLTIGLSIGLILTNKELVDQKEEYKDEIKELEEKIDTYQTSNNSNNSNNSSNNDKEDNNATSNEDYNLTQMTFKEFKNKLNNKDSFLVLFTQTNCSHCIAFKPVISEVIEEENLTIYELNIETFTMDEWNELTELVSVSGTPTLTYIKDGSEKNSLVGNRDKKSIQSFLDKEGLA